MRQRRFEARGHLGWLLACALLLALATPTSASADLSFCPPGSAAGQCEEPAGVATDFETGRLYVADRDNNRIDVFAADGAFLFAFGWAVNASAPEEKLQVCTPATGCKAGAPGAGDGQLSKPRRLAVDNDPASAARHDVYVFDSGNFRVQKFGPNGEFKKKAGSKGTGPGQFNDEIDLIALGPGGTVYVSDMPKFAEEPRIERFDSNLAPIDECRLPHEDRLNNGLAVDGAGAIYATFNQANGIFKFAFKSPTCEEVGAPRYPLDTKSEPTALAVDDAGHLFVREVESRVGKAGGFFRMITSFEPSGAYRKRFAYDFGEAGVSNGIAALHRPAGDLFASLNDGASRVAYLKEPQPGPAFTPELEVVASNTKASLGAELNPEGKASEYRFEYVDRKSFEEEGGWASPNTKQTPFVEVPIAPGTPEEEERQLFSLHAAEALAGCAEPLSEAGHPGETEIEAGNCLLPETEYRVRVIGKSADGENTLEAQFETAQAAEIEETWASEPTTTGARLSARVNPLGIPTTGFFEYVDQASFEASGFANAKQVPDLSAGQSPLDFGSGEAGVVRSVALDGLTSGTSYRYRLSVTDPLLAAPLTGPVRALRPFAKPASAPCPNDGLRGGEGALLPDCRAYELVSPLDKNNGDVLPMGEFTTAVPAALSQSSVSGEKVSYGSSRAFGDTLSAPYTSQYIAERGPGGWQSHAIQSPRGKLELALGIQVSAEFKLFSDDLCQAWQRTMAAPPLTEDAVAGYSNLYRRTDQSCGGAPDYEALTTLGPPSASVAEYERLELQGASADGEVAIYAAPDNLVDGLPPEPALCTSKGEGCQQRLYEKRPGQAPVFVCYLPGGEPTAPCQAGAGAGGQTVEGKGLYGGFQHAISVDGSRIYWTAAGKIYLRVEGKETLAVSAAGEALSKTSSSRFWAATADGAKALYQSGADLYLFDAVSEATTLVAHQVKGVAGASEDLSHIYFVSGAVLDEGAQAGKANLYLSEEGATRFVATLADADVSTTLTLTTGVPIYHTARVSPGGETLAFLSAAPLTGYDNTDVASPAECGVPKGVCDVEAFIYQAEAEGGAGELICASCNPSGARPRGTDIAGELRGIPPLQTIAAAKLPGWENNQYASRLLSDNGQRLFFEAFDALSPLDTNGVIDVYQWEATGEGSCNASSASYSPDSEGCINLISSGKSPRESNFLDADPTGQNAFFTTLSSLLPQDYGLIDVYDARAGGGFPVPAPPRAKCEGEACQSPAQAPIDPTPASSSFRGAGNVVQRPARKHRKRHGKRRHHRRATHERRAAR